MAAALAKTQFCVPGQFVQLLQSKPSQERPRGARKIWALHNDSSSSQEEKAIQSPSTRERLPEERKQEVSPKQRRRAPLISTSRESTQHLGRRSLLSKGLLAAALCPLCAQAPHAAAAEWGYGGPAGALGWGGMCSIGRSQSPVDLSVKGTKLKVDAMGKLQFEYNPTDVTILNTAHGTMQVNFPVGTNMLHVGRKTLDLLQYHFHSPSEHAFDGQRYHMEAHLVHKDRETGDLGVIGTLIQAVPDGQTTPNPAIAAALELAPREHGAKKAAEICTPNCSLVKVCAEDLLPTASDPDIRSYFHYQGSLTTPPCSERVEWFLMENVLRIPRTQLVDFMEYVGDRKTLALNSRPLQPMRARELTRGPM